MNGLVVSVEFDDLLAETLPRNAGHFERIVVITSPADKATQEVAAGVANAELHLTDAFYRGGAAFNKGAAIEEGFDVLGRHGWICVHDADVVMPQKMLLLMNSIRPGNLYVPRRRMCRDLSQWHGQTDWSGWKVLPEKDFAGYFQLFHASDPVLARRPWYDVGWRHAGGCDTFFSQRWPSDKKRRLPFEVLHLGEDYVNWHGRCTRRLDGTLPADADERREAQRKMYADRRQHGFRLERLDG